MYNDREYVCVEGWKLFWKFSIDVLAKGTLSSFYVEH